MTSPARKNPPVELLYLAVLLVYPLLVYPEVALFRLTEISIGMQLTYLFIYAILALGLNVVSATPDCCIWASRRFLASAPISRAF